MTSQSNSSDSPEKSDDSTDSIEEISVDEIDESLNDEPVVIEAEAVEIEESSSTDEELGGSDSNVESFPPEQQPTRSSGLGMLFGGLVAGAIGFGACFLWFDRFSGLSLIHI